MSRPNAALALPPDERPPAYAPQDQQISDGNSAPIPPELGAGEREPAVPVAANRAVGLALEDEAIERTVDTMQKIVTELGDYRREFGKELTERKFNFLLHPASQMLSLADKLQAQTRHLIKTIERR